MRNEDAFVLVEASKLSLDDKFMKHKPKNKREEELKELLKKVIKKGIKDFYRPRYDPSFNEDGTSVNYEAGENPAIGKSYNWWDKVAKEYMPKRHSRLGTKSEYIAFLGVLIKELVSTGLRVDKAWAAICNDSSKLGNLSDYKNVIFEKTGSREVCGFFDLANTYKILMEDKDDISGGYWLGATGIVNFNDWGDYWYYPVLMGIQFEFNRKQEDRRSVGWIVLEK